MSCDYIGFTFLANIITFVAKKKKNAITLDHSHNVHVCYSTRDAKKMGTLWFFSAIIYSSYSAEMKVHAGKRSGLSLRYLG